MILSSLISGAFLQLTKQQKAVIRPGETITIHEKFDGSIRVVYSRH